MILYFIKRCGEEGERCMLQQANCWIHGTHQDKKTKNKTQFFLSCLGNDFSDTGLAQLAELQFALSQSASHTCSSISHGWCVLMKRLMAASYFKIAPDFQIKIQVTNFQKHIFFLNVHLRIQIIIIIQSSISVWITYRKSYPVRSKDWTFLYKCFIYLSRIRAEPPQTRGCLGYFRWCLCGRLSLVLTTWLKYKGHGMPWLTAEPCHWWSQMPLWELGLKCFDLKCVSAHFFKRKTPTYLLFLYSGEMKKTLMFILRLKLILSWVALL